MQASGFRGIRGVQSIAFEEMGNGLFFVRGDNRVEPELSPNAAGKTTLWDAVSWALRGKTARDVGAAHVESWEGDTACRVLLVVRTSTGVHHIVRRRNPIELFVDGSLATEEQLEDAIGFRPDLLLHTGLMGQFGRLFFDLAPAERLKLLSNILDLDSWLADSKRAQARCEDAGRRAAGAEQLCDRARERACVLHGHLLDQERDHARYLAEVGDRARQVREERSLLVETLERYQEEEAAVQGVLDSLANSKTLEKELVALDTKARGVEKDVAHLSASIKSLERECGDLERKIQKLQRLSDARCPTCGQLVSGDAVEAGVGLLEKELARKERELDGLTSKRKDAAQEARSIQASAAQIDGELTKLEKREKQLREEAAGLRAVAEKTRVKLSALDEQLETLRHDDSWWEDRIEGLEKEVADAVAWQEHHESLRSQLEREAELAKTCGALFKEVRLWRLDQALLELAIHVNSSLVELGLHGWKVEFAVERETKSGGVSRGFHVFVTSPASPGKVPWESWSGGETQRLRIAGAVGVAELIRSRVPDVPRFEVWDEPTAHLSENGILDLIDFFRDRAEDRQVFLIDHHSIDSGAFEGIIHVVKTRDEGIEIGFERVAQ